MMSDNRITGIRLDGNINYPKQWGVVRLESIAKMFISGGTPRTNIEEYWNGDIPWITGVNINKRLISEGKRYITQKGVDESATNIVPKEGILLVTRVDVGRAGVAGVDIAISQDMTGIVLDHNRASPEYLCWYINYNTKNIQRYNQGSTIQGLTRDDIEQFLIPLPLLPEQHRIASILSNVDFAIQKTQEIIDQMKRVKQGLMQQLLTRGIGHTEFKRTRIGHKELKIPKEWNVVKLEDIVEVTPSNVDKKTHEDEVTVNLCNYLDVYNNDYIRQGINFMKATASEKEIEKFSLRMDDVIITKDSEVPNDIAKPTVVIEDLENVICGYHLALLRPKRKRVRGTFLAKMLSSRPINDQFTNNAQGLTRFGLNVTAILKAQILLPPIYEQKNIFHRLYTIDARIEKEAGYKASLEKVKKGLMQVLLTGKVRVKVKS